MIGQIELWLVVAANEMQRSLYKRLSAIESVNGEKVPWSISVSGVWKACGHGCQYSQAIDQVGAASSAQCNPKFGLANLPVCMGMFVCGM